MITTANHVHLVNTLPVPQLLLESLLAGLASNAANSVNSTVLLVFNKIPLPAVDS